VSICGQPHPSEPVTCDKSTPCWGSHAHDVTGLFWPGNVMPTPQTNRDLMLSIRQRTESDVRSGAPSAAVERWDRTDWVRDTTAALRALCEDHTTFTTGDLWSRIDDVPDRRAMVSVVRNGLRRGWMTEAGGERVDRYRTRDGHEIPINKIVPVYQSLLGALV
jgi:hypothetical protein